MRNEIHRVKKGNLESARGLIPVDFGIIYQEDGIITGELYINESYRLTPSFDDNLSQVPHTLNCITENEEDLEMRAVFFTEVAFTQARITVLCYDCLITKNVDPFPAPDLTKEPLLYYIELEGLRLEFSGKTTVNKIRAGKEVRDGLKYQYDHTFAELTIANMSFQQIFSKDGVDAKNIIQVRFPVDTQLLPYSTFENIKNAYVSFLSFLNGATVRIRKECVSSYYAGDRLEPEQVIVHSFNTIKNESYSHYINLSSYSNHRVNILDLAFKKFNLYLDWNNKIDLNSIVFYLNAAEKTISLEEKFFIQIIAFERLCALYSEQLGITDILFPTNAEFLEIKEELLNTLSAHKNKFGPYYNAARSKLSNLNMQKRLSTTEKMYTILRETKIGISNELRELIDIVRHRIIHKGDVDQSRKGQHMLYLLNELLQEIIVRLIGFNPTRHSRFLFQRSLFQDQQLVTLNAE